MSPRALVVVCLVAATGACWKPPFLEVQTYALASIEAHAPPVPLDSLDWPQLGPPRVLSPGEIRSLHQLVPGYVPPLDCRTSLTDAYLYLRSDSLWELDAHRVRHRSMVDAAAAATIDTSVDWKHGPFRRAGDTLKLKLDETGFVLVHGMTRGDSVILERDGRRWVLVRRRDRGQ